MRGVISGAMLMALHAMGFRNSFDAVYGASAGASAQWGWRAVQFALSLRGGESSALCTQPLQAGKQSMES